MDLAVRIVGGLIRAALGPFLQDVVARGYLSASDTEAAIWGLAGVIVAGAWSAYNHYTHNEEVSTLRAALALRARAEDASAPPPRPAA